MTVFSTVRRHDGPDLRQDRQARLEAATSLRPHSEQWHGPMPSFELLSGLLHLEFVALRSAESLSPPGPEPASLSSTSDSHAHSSLPQLPPRLSPHQQHEPSDAAAQWNKQWPVSFAVMAGDTRIELPTAAAQHDVLQHDTPCVNNSCLCSPRAPSPSAVV